MDLEIIKQPQRNVKEPIINKNLIINIVLSAFIIIVGTLFVFYKEVSFLKFFNVIFILFFIKMSFDKKVTPRDTTMTFTCFVFFDMWNALSCRSSKRMIWEIGLFKYFIFFVKT